MVLRLTVPRGLCHLTFLGCIPRAICAAFIAIVPHLCHICGTMKNPRISVVLTPSLAALLAQMAEETGESAASFVRDLLIQSEPALHRMLQLVVAAKSAKGQIGSGLHDTMDRVLRDLEGAAERAQHAGDHLIADLVAQSEAIRPRRRAAAPSGKRSAEGRGGLSEGGSTPVPVTRGSGTPKGAPVGKGTRRKAGS